ncbi:thioredoxin family protein [Patulibacter defluvii]|uniref:thioredoxin family protein n=1 Tax=Patulibacter defluvii TaxID=3095358 RepID=UPI002A756E3B|nr:thioredoxin domain-containing protein [Patulibacter sp. DM4]
MTTTHPLPAVTDDRFAADVLEADQPVLVEFWAAWCPPCRRLRPLLERLDDERDDLRVMTLDIDEHQRTAAAYGILSAPTMILFRDGAPVRTLVGFRPYARLLADLELDG